MEKFISLSREGEEERDGLPISPVAFGSGTKFPAVADAHLLLCVKAGECLIQTPSGEESLGEGGMLFARAGHPPRVTEASPDLAVEFVLFEATEGFLAHLELPDLEIGEIGEGGGISQVVKMSPYALEYAHDRLKICAAVYSALAKLARDRMIGNLERFDTLADRLSPAMLQIEQRFAEPLTVRTLAHSCSMSESTFSRLFKRMYGCTPVQFLIRKRLDTAKELLATTDRPLEDIARACGFRSAKYFGDMLRKNEHVTPTELREMYRGMTQMRFF